MIFLEIALGDRGGHFGDVAHLAGEVRGHRVHVVGEVLPYAGDAGNLRLPAEPSVPTSRATRDTSLAKAFSWSTMVLNGVLELETLPFTSTVIFFERPLFATAVVTSAILAHLAGKVGGHGVHVVREVLPHAGDAFHLRLAAELAVGADSRATRDTSPAKALS